MGTNYYLVEKQNPAQHRFFTTTYHIAKTSAGWKPLFEAQMVKTAEGYADMRSVAMLGKIFAQGNYYIVDEYEKEYSFAEFVSKIDSHAEAAIKCHYNGCFFDDDGYEFTRQEFC